MKHLMSIAALGIIATASLSAPAQAQMFAGGINNTQAILEARINTGIRNGSLTRQEAYNLQNKLRRINVMEARFRNSGRNLTASERNILSNELSRLSQEVSFQINDRDGRFRNRHHRRGF